MDLPGFSKNPAGSLHFFPLARLLLLLLLTSFESNIKVQGKILLSKSIKDSYPHLHNANKRRLLRSEDLINKKISFEKEWLAIRLLESTTQIQPPVFEKNPEDQEISYGLEPPLNN